MCEHIWAYDGLRYCHGARSLPGSGASRRYYAHVYHCTRCLETVGRSVPSMQSSYVEPHETSTPGTPDECCVPLEDRQ